MTSAEVVERAAPAVPPNTTKEEDRYTLAKRKIDLIWEATQAVLAVMIVGANIVSVFRPVSSPEASATMANVMLVVVTFYYVRTNHKRSGGTEATK